MSANTARLRDFVTGLADLLDRTSDEGEILEKGGALLGDLVAHDDWLPAELSQPHPEHYQQYLLYADARENFSVVSFVWGPGQATPIHNHTVWGLIGMLRGQRLGLIGEARQRIAALAAAQLGGRTLPLGLERSHLILIGK